MEDAQRLQQVMDASIKVHGEMNSLYDLVFSFLECGRIRQAKKVLEVMLGFNEIKLNFLELIYLE
jgi:hypothetical protein